MKKTLLAAALAVGFAGVAQAETSVTLYGIIDTGIAYDQVKRLGVDANGDAKVFKGKKFGIYDGGNLGQAGSRWGLRGVEDLGNGLRAVFVLESGLDITNGGHGQGGRAFGRQATIGLHSDSWGQVDFGRQTNIASKYLIGMVDPFAGGFGTANGGSTIRSANTVRYDNTIIYQTPNFNGFQFGIGYAFNTNSGGNDVDNGSQSYKWSGIKDNNSRAFTTGLKYANGPIAVALTYDQISNSFSKHNVAPGQSKGKNVRAWNIGGSYDFEVVKVSAAFGQSRGGAIDVGNTDYDKAAAFVPGDQRKGRLNNYLFGLSAPVGGGTIMASYGLSSPNKKWGDSDERKKQHTYGLGYKYPLSKRTDVYAYAAQQKNVNYVRKAKRTTVAVGMTHRF